MSAQLQVTGEAKIRDLQGPVVANSGVITALDGLPSQYVRGDGTLADIPSVTGGGASVSYYLNGSVNQGTFGGSTYYQLGETAITGVGTNFSTSTDGLLAQFITDVNVPDVTEIPSGNWNIEFYMGVSASSGALASFYVEIYKYDGTTFTLIGTNITTPEFLTNTTTVDAYFTSVAMPLTAMAETDRIAIRVYANVASKTVTMYTEDNRLCQVVTTFSRGMLSLNSLTDQQQYLTVGTAGTDFNIVSALDTHTFNIPSASATNRGLITTGTQTIAGDKTLSGNNTFSANNTFTNDILVNGLTIGKGAGTLLTNTATGVDALDSNTTGIYNSAFGYNSLKLNTTGFNNTSIGNSALSTNTTGYQNTAIGSFSMEKNTTGYVNTATGTGTLMDNTTGYGNSAFGDGSLASNTTGNVNTAVGTNALGANTTANQNTAVGGYALWNNTTGYWNTAIGASAMQSNSTGYVNTAIGYTSLQSNTTGSGNVAVGYATLESNTTGVNNVGIGQASLLSNTTGNHNTAVGISTLQNTVGSNNTAIGHQAGELIYTGSNNTIVGVYQGTSAMSNNVILADGQGNIRYQFDGTKNIFNNLTWFENLAYGKKGYALLKGGIFTGLGILQDDTYIYSDLGDKNIVIKDVDTSFAKLQFQDTGNFTYTFPDESGTIALLEANQNITGFKQFSDAAGTWLDYGFSLVKGNTPSSLSSSKVSVYSNSGDKNLVIADTFSSFAKLQFQSTGNLTYTFPALSGTIALLEGSQTFTGEKVFNNNALFNSVLSVNYGAWLQKGTPTATFSSAFTTLYSEVGAINAVFRDNTNQAKLQFQAASNYTYTFPASSGTIALTSNLSSYVPYTGATSDVNLGMFSITTTSTSNAQIFNANGSAGSAGQISMKWGTGFSAATGYSTLGGFNNGFLLISNIAGNQKFGIFDLSTLTTSVQRTYTLPDASGTLALTSQTGSLTAGSYFLTGMTAGSGALYYNAGANRVTLANYNASGILTFEVNGGATALTLASTGAATFSANQNATSNFTFQNTNTTDSNSRAYLNLISGATSLIFKTISGDHSYIDSTSNLYFQSAGSVKMTMLSSGNVGIGTSSPVNYTNYRSLHISGASSNSSAILYLTNSTESIRGLFFAEGSANRVTIGSQSNHDFTFLTNDTERMRITSAGVLNFNGNSTESSYNDKFSIGFSNDNYAWIQTWSGRPLYLNRIGNAVYAGTQRIDNNSDQRIKENIVPIENALDVVLSLKGRKFNMLDEDGILRYGFVAQEVQPHLSDFVTESDRTFEKDDIKIKNLLTLESSGAAWGALLVEAIKEQQAQIEAQDAKIEELKALIAAK